MENNIFNSVQICPYSILTRFNEPDIIIMCHIYSYWSVTVLQLPLTTDIKTQIFVFSLDFIIVPDLKRCRLVAVSELGPKDSDQNIFKPNWLKKNSPICKIERILKESQLTTQCRDTVKARARQTTRKDVLCATNNNELFGLILILFLNRKKPSRNI